MNLNEAKTILLLYRPGTTDAEDPQIAEALALAKQSPELARWLAEQTARQTQLRGQFQQIPVPAGLQAQILAETVAPDRMVRLLHPTACVKVAVVFVPITKLVPTLTVFENAATTF